MKYKNETFVAIYRSLADNAISVIEDNTFKNIPNLEYLWVSLNIIYRKVCSIYDNICRRYCLFSILNRLLTNVYSELYTYVIDTELQLSGKKSLTIPKEQSESIFGVAYYVFVRAWQNKIS
jgi:hypothetical protein